jgi:thiol-disulfide isomerase/thioredoxin
MQIKWLTWLLLALATATSAQGQVNIGDIPPDALGTDRHDNEVHISAFRGKVVVVSFWASWCTYCLKELPVLEKVQQVVGKSRIEVVAVNIDRDRGDYLAMRRQLKNFQFTMTRDDRQAVAKLYGANALPFLLMISKDGRVAHLYKGYSEEMLDGFVDEINGLLDEPEESATTQAAGG